MEDVIKKISEIPELSRYVFVDSENVGSSWIDMLEKSGEARREVEAKNPVFAFMSRNGVEESLYIVFYTDKSPNVTYEDLIRYAKYKDITVMIKCFTGEKAASALDFQLVSVAGFLMQKYPDAKYDILSKDKGYDPMVKFWISAGYDINRIEPEINEGLPIGLDLPEVADENVEQIPPPSDFALLTKNEKKKARDDFIAQILPDKDKKTRDIVKTFMATYLNNDQSAGSIYLTIVKQFGQKEGLSIYHSIKPHLEEYRQYK